MRYRSPYGASFIKNTFSNKTYSQPSGQDSQAMQAAYSVSVVYERDALAKRYDADNTASDDNDNIVMMSENAHKKENNNEIYL